MHLEEIDGELHILDENLNIIHVFERAKSSDANGEVTLSRPVYKHMCAWIKTHWTRDAASKKSTSLFPLGVLDPSYNFTLK